MRASKHVEGYDSVSTGMLSLNFIYTSGSVKLDQLQHLSRSDQVDNGLWDEPGTIATGCI